MGLRDSIAKFNAAQAQPQPKTVLPPEAGKVLLEQTLPEVEKTTPSTPLPTASTPSSDKPVLPPEAVKVLLEQTVPEVEKSVTPSPAPVAPLPSTPTVEASREKRKRRTKAEMEAARAALAGKAETVGSSTSTPAPTPVTGENGPLTDPGFVFLADASDRELVAELFTRGYSVTKL